MRHANDTKPFLSVEDNADRAVRLGINLLQVGSLYTGGRLAFSVVAHERGQKPRLKLKLYPAWFVESMAQLKTEGIGG